MLVEDAKVEMKICIKQTSLRLIFKKILGATVVILQFITPNASHATNIRAFVEDLNDNKHVKTKVGIGSSTLYMNYGLDEFKDSVIASVKERKDNSDVYYKFFGLRTDGESYALLLQDYFDGEYFKKHAVKSPGFSLKNVRAIYINYKNLYDNKYINIKKYYGQAKARSVNNNESLDEHLNSIAMNALMETSAKNLVDGYYKNGNPGVGGAIEISMEQQNYRDKVDNIYKDWKWFLQGYHGAPMLGIDEITENILNMGWIVMHEAAHIYNDGGLDWASGMEVDVEKKLIKEMHSDIYAAVFIPSVSVEDHYNKLDSMMFSRIMSYKAASHFTVAPIMALKILISKAGLWDQYSNEIKKEELARLLTSISKKYIEDIVDIVNNNGAQDQSGTVKALKKIVFLMVKDLAVEIHINSDV